MAQVNDINKLNLGSVTLGGGLTVTSGELTQSGALTVSGATNITATGQPISLPLANDFQGTASFSGSNVQVNDINALNLGAGAISGNLDVFTAGAISQAGVLTVAGASNFNAGGNSISLNLNNNFTGAVSVNNTGANNVVLNNGGAMVLSTSSVGSGTLTVTAGGDITQTGPLTQAGAGAASFAVGGIGGVALTNAGNNFLGTATFSVTQGDVQVTDVDALTAVVNVGVAGTPLPKVQAGGALIVSGTTPGLKTITTGGAGSTTTFGTTTISGGTGALDVTSAGAISQTGVITAPNLLLATTSANALLNSQTNVITALGATALGTGALNLLDAGGLTVAGAVGATTAIILNTSGALAINNTLNAGPGSVSLTTTGAGNSISQTAAGVITAGNLAVTTTNANAVLTTATNVVSALGPITQGLGGMDLKNAANLTFSGAVNNAGFLLNNTGTAAIHAPINTGAGNLTLNSTGGITQNAAGTITSNSIAVTTTNANATLNVAVNNVPNFGPGNVGTSAVAFSAAGPLTIPARLTPRAAST